MTSDTSNTLCLCQLSDLCASLWPGECEIHPPRWVVGRGPDSPHYAHCWSQRDGYELDEFAGIFAGLCHIYSGHPMVLLVRMN